MIANGNGSYLVLKHIFLLCGQETIMMFQAIAHLIKLLGISRKTNRTGSTSFNGEMHALDVIARE